MRSVQCGPAAGLLSQLAFLSALSLAFGLGSAGWGIGLAAAIAANGLLAGAIARRNHGGLGPADWVTLLRSVLAGGAAALVADLLAAPAGGPAQRPGAVAVLVSLAFTVIALDAVDGHVARRTGTTSELGARFDMEVDAFLILVMSVYAAPKFGPWVLAIGLARYVFVAAGWFLAWLRGSAPPRHWNKVVAVVQGLALAVAAADVLPRAFMAVLLGAALVLLAESFGRESWWLWRQRREAGHAGGARSVGRGSVGSPSGAGARVGHPRGGVVVPPSALTVTAGIAVWCVLLAPQHWGQLVPTVFVGLPLEVLAMVPAAFLPRAWRKAAAIAIGLFLGLAAVVKALDMAFFIAFDRPFDPVNDWYYFGPGLGVIGDSVGPAGAVAVVAGALLFAAAALFLLPLSVLRLTGAVAAHRGVSLRGAAVFAAVWALAAVSGLQSAPGVPAASFGTAGLVRSQAALVHDGLADRAAFAAELARDPAGAAIAAGSSAAGDSGSSAAGDGLGSAGDPAAGGGRSQTGLLTALKGKDVLLVFVESYGRVALEDPALAPGVTATLREGNASLRAAGFSSRSAFLTSPTFGGASWLAHSTLQSGLWVDSQQRYNQLLTSNRTTLTGAFSQAGWRTVSDVPSDTTDWPQGARFYHFDALYDSRNVGYNGPKFSYAAMPDQYVLSAFQRLELAPAGRGPVMAEIDLVSSHTPWTPLPRPVPWEQVGDGSIFNGMPAQGASPESVAGDPGRVKALYGQSVEYSLGTIFSFVAAHPDPNLVMIVLGDHQPSAQVSGAGPGRDVPVSILAHDPAVMDRISAWGWTAGMEPGHDAPLWPMSGFRDRFLAAFSPDVKILP